MAGGNAQTRVPSMSDYLTAGVNAIHGPDPLLAGASGPGQVSALQAAQALMSARSVAPSAPVAAPVVAPVGVKPGLSDFLNAMQASGGAGASDSVAAETGSSLSAGGAIARALAPAATPVAPAQSTQDRIAAATAEAAAGAAKAPYELQSSNDLLGGAVHDVLSNNKTVPISVMGALAGILPGYTRPIDPKVIAGQRLIGMTDTFYQAQIAEAQAKGDTASATELQKQYLDRLQTIQGTNPQAQSIAELVQSKVAG